MDLGLDGKRALVTGSTAGIGFATARALAAEGAEVVVNGRTEARVAAAAQKIERELPDARVSGIAADLGTAAGCAALLEKLPEVDVLVNNVGIFEPKPFEEIPDEDWRHFFEVNVLSTSLTWSKHKDFPTSCGTMPSRGMKKQPSGCFLVSQMHTVRQTTST